MALDVRSIFVIGVAAVLISRYYLEKHYKRLHLFWACAGLSTALGLISAYTVSIEHPSKGVYIPLTAIAIVMAILYYQSDEELARAEG